MTVLRLALGALLLALGLWVVIGEQLAGASADAVVNGHLITVRTPIAGTLSQPGAALGGAVGEGEALATVRDRRADGIHRDDIQVERDRAIAELERLAAHIAAVEAEIAALQQVGRQLRSARVERSPDGTGERLELLETALEGVRETVLLANIEGDDGGGTAATVRILSLRTEAARLRADRDAAEAGLASLSARLEREQARLAGATEATLTAPAEARLWERLAHDGEEVQRGDPVARLLECGSGIVTASVSESTYNRLKAGDQAVFRAGQTGRTYPASILRMAGSGAATVYRSLAIAPGRKHLERYDVALLVPGLRDDPVLRCTVGQTGRVFFGHRPLDWLRGGRLDG